MLNVMNAAAAVDIQHEKQGGPPPRQFVTWPDYWRAHFANLHYTPPKRERKDDPMKNVGNLHLTWVRQRRTALGLPAFE